MKEQLGNMKDYIFIIGVSERDKRKSIGDGKEMKILLWENTNGR